jgi:hypothetical protein
MIHTHKLFRILVVALAAIWLAFTLSTPSDAGWLKKAKKAAKKAAHKVEKNVKAEAKRAGENISREGKRFGGDVSREAKRFGGDISREGKKFGGDVSREGKRFAGDVSREGKKFAGDISRETKKFGRDINREFNKGLPAISLDNVGRGLNRLGTNMDKAGTQFTVNIGRGNEQLGHNLTQGERRLAHNIDRGADSWIRNVGGEQWQGPFWGKVMVGGIATPLAPIFRDTTWGGINRLISNIGDGAGKVGDSVRDEWERGYRNVWNETVGAPRVTDTSKSESEQETTTGQVGSPTAKKGKAKIGSEDTAETPVAIFRAEKSGAYKESTLGSEPIFKEQTRSDRGSSTRGASGSPVLGGSPTGMKKESGAPLSTGGPMGGGHSKKK